MWKVLSIVFGSLLVVAVALSAVYYSTSQSDVGTTQKPPVTVLPVSSSSFPETLLSLSENLPPTPPIIVGNAILEPFGTTILLTDGFAANTATSEYFLFGRPIVQDRFQEEVSIYLVVSSDTMNRFNVREPGYIYFGLEPQPGQGVWEFSIREVICENAETLKNGKYVYTTKVMGKLRTRGDYSHFRLKFANFEPRIQHQVSWAIYRW